MFEEGLLGAIEDTVSKATTNVMDVTQNEVQGSVDYFHNKQENLYGSAFDLMQSNDPLKQSHLFKCVPFPGTHWVDTYIRTDGTIVDGHLKTNPDEVTWNNFSEQK